MGFFTNLFKSKRQNQPEEDYVTFINDDLIRVSHATRDTEEIKWSDIEEIKLVNTDEGPFAPDIWLILIGNDKGCSIPHGSTGYEKVYDIVSKYEGFNFSNVIESMGSTDNGIFELWKR